MRIRIKFRKYGNMRFVGHLDLMRYFQRAMRRAEIDLAYSEGFHPHPQMSFALPLGIGLTSDGEYMDITVNSTSPSYDAIKALNSEMAEGVEITGYILLPEEAKKAMASVAAADYLVCFRNPEDFDLSGISSGIRSYYEDRDAIPVAKKTKKSERMLDLKPLIYRMEPCFDDNDMPVAVKDISDNDFSGVKGIFLRLSAGSADNIRPELVVEDFFNFLGLGYDPLNFRIHRLELYEAVDGGSLHHQGDASAAETEETAETGVGTAFIPLIAAGEVIPGKGTV